MRAAFLEVIGAERGRQVHDPGPVIHRHEVGGHDGVGVVHVRVRRLVARADERRTVERLATRPTLTEHPLGQGDGHDQAIAVSFIDGVGPALEHRGALVGRQRPRRGGPHQ